MLASKRRRYNVSAVEYILWRYMRAYRRKGKASSRNRRIPEKMCMWARAPKTKEGSSVINPSTLMKYCARAPYHALIIWHNPAIIHIFWWPSKSYQNQREITRKHVNEAEENLSLENHLTSCRACRARQIAAWHFHQLHAHHINIIHVCSVPGTKPLTVTKLNLLF